MMGGGELIDDEDRKTSIFVGEITESLQRGIEEGVDANNLVLEINSSRYVKIHLQFQYESTAEKNGLRPFLTDFTSRDLQAGGSQAVKH